jgi:hypothetical protein
MVKPFSLNSMSFAPKLMHGAPATVQVTLPTNWLFSDIVSVLEMVPLMSTAEASAALSRSPQTKIASLVYAFKLFITVSPFISFVGSLFPASLCHSL